MPTAYTTEETRHAIPDTVAGVNWQQQAANFLSLAGKVPASPVFMDHYLPDDKRKRQDGSTAYSTPSSSPTSSTIGLSGPSSTTNKQKKEFSEEIGQGPELAFRL